MMPTKTQPKAKQEAKKSSPKPKIKREVISEKKVVYPHIEVNGVRVPGDSFKITAQMAKDILKWETEADYFNRRKEEDPGIPREACDFGNDYLLIDEHKNAVRCWNNSRNRPFSESWARSLAQDILNKKWRFNCETIVISKTGVVLSGQHRLAGLVLAYQLWAKDNVDRWRETWGKMEPYILALVVTGAEEDQDTVNTLDNVRPRSLGDVFYTSDRFKDMHKDVKIKASKMLESAVNLLWRRTSPAHSGAADRYQTISTSSEFLDRHKKLLEFIHYFLEIDKEYALSSSVKRGGPGFKSIGQCSALLYLQASAGSDPDDYLANEPRSEDVLNWDMKAKAERFWQEIADDTALFEPLRRGLQELFDPDSGEDSKFPVKMALLAKAWALFAEDNPLSIDSILPDMRENEDGELELATPWPTFGGIDFGEPGKMEEKEEEGEMSREELERRKAQERARRTSKMEKRIRKGKSKDEEEE